MRRRWQDREMKTSVLMVFGIWAPNMPIRVHYEIQATAIFLARPPFVRAGGLEELSTRLHSGS